MTDKQEFLRTIVYGESALGYIKRCEVAAFPRHYELWYTYSAGFNQELNQEINRILKLRNKLTLEETTQIYDRFLSPYRLGDRMDELGADLNEHLGEIISMVGNGADSTSEFGDTLDKISVQISKHSDSDSLVKIAKALRTATTMAKETQGELERELRTAQEQIKTLKDNLEAVRFETLSDDLTGLANRKHFDLSLAQLLQSAEQDGETFSMMVLDIDKYKQFNDNFGHQTGDQVLRLVALTLKNNIKGRDLAARYGGDEFALLLPLTDADAALKLGEQIRSAIANRELKKRSTGENLGSVTVSIGLAEYQKGDNEQTLFHRADAAMYEAKYTGRNRVRSHSEEMAGDPKKMAS